MRMTKQPKTLKTPKPLRSPKMSYPRGRTAHEGGDLVVAEVHEEPIGEDDVGRARRALKLQDVRRLKVHMGPATTQMAIQILV